MELLAHGFTWLYNSSPAVYWMGMSFVLLEANEVILQGQKCVPRAQSPIHSEGLLWAMKEVRDRGFDDIRFISDCQQLINLIFKDEE
ncbi:hypothetical protein Bca4012_014242 [Brassica carinata]